MDFIFNNLLLIILFLVALFVIGIFFRALKFALFIGIIVLILGFFGFLGDDFGDKAKNTFDKASSYTQETIVPFVQGSLETADFSYNKETKEYVIGSENFSIKGKEGTNVATFTVNGTSKEIDASFLSDFITKKIAETNASPQ